MSNSYISIFVKEVQIKARVGVLPQEKGSPQRLGVCMEIFAAPHYLTHTDIIDYSLLYNEVLSWQDRPHTELLETLMAELFALGFSFASAQAVRVQLVKPDIFTATQQAGLSGYITRQDYENEILNKMRDDVGIL